MIVVAIRLIDAAIAQYANDNNKATGVEITFVDLQPYLKKGGALYHTGQDILGNDFGTFAVDTFPYVPTATLARFLMSPTRLSGRRITRSTPRRPRRLRRTGAGAPLRPVRAS